MIGEPFKWLISMKLISTSMSRPLEVIFVKRYERTDLLSVDDALSGVSSEASKAIDRLWNCPDSLVAI